MGAIIPILLALNIVVASIATPVFISGMGLGSGAGGSSFPQKTDLPSNSDQLAKTFKIFTNSCDPESWNDPSMPYPDTEGKLAEVIRDTKWLDRAASIQKEKAPCQPLKKGKAGIIFVGGNNEEIIHLLKNFWDFRTLDSVIGLIGKRFELVTISRKTSQNSDTLLTDKAQAATSGQIEKVGYQEKCDFGKKSAPFLTLHVTAGYMDIRGRPTQMGRAGIEDDRKAAERSNKAISPHSRGQGVDIHTAGCTVIKQGKEIKQVIANSIALGQEARPESSAPSGESVQEMVSAVDFPDPEIMEPALNESFEDNSTLITAGIDEAERQGLGSFLAAEGVVDPDIEPDLIPFDIDEISGNPSSDKKPTFYEKAAQIAERVIEKQKQLPAGFLSKGTDLNEMGRAALFDQTGKILGKNPTAEQIASLATDLGKLENPEYTAMIPAKAIEYLKSGQSQKGLSLIALTRLKKQFSTSWTESDINEKLEKGLPSDELVKLLKSELAVSDPQDEEMLKAVASGGYSELAKTFENFQALADQTVSGSLVKTLQEVDQLNSNQITALNDFQKPEFRSGVASRLENLNAPKPLVDWIRTNATLKADDEEAVKAIIDQYCTSSNGKQKLINVEGNVATNIIRSAVKLMEPDEQQVFYSVFGANPTTESLKKGFDNGLFDKAAEATWIARTLQFAGVSKAESINLATSVASGKGSPLESGVKLFNTQFGSYGINFTGADLKIDPMGLLQAVTAKIAPGLIAKIGRIDIDSVIGFFRGDQSKRGQVVSAITTGNTLTSNVQGILNDAVTKNLGGATSFSEFVAKTGATTKAAALSAAITSGPPEQIVSLRAQNTRTLEDAINATMDAKIGDSTFLPPARIILTDAGVPLQTSNEILSGTFQYSANKVAVAHTASVLSQNGYGDSVSLKKAMTGQLSTNQLKSVSDQMSQVALSNNKIDIKEPVVTTLTGINEAAKLNLRTEVGNQVIANGIVNTAKENNIGGVTLASAKGFADGLDSSGTLPVASAINSKDAKIAQEAQLNNKVYNQAVADGTLTVQPKQSTGDETLEAILGFSPDKVFNNIGQTLKDLPQNFLDSYSVQGIQSQLAGIGAGVIVNTLIGNKLAEIDPTGGILTQFAMNYAAHFIMTLGISMPILLGIAFIINPTATLEAIKGMIMLVFNLFKDPIGTILSMFGLGPKPKAESAVTNSTNKTTDVLNKPPNEWVGPPAGDNPPQNAALGTGRALAADATQNKAEPAGPVQATSDYLPGKKPTKSYLEKISRRTTDHIVEDLLLQAVAASGNRDLIRDDPDFVTNHWTRYIGSPPKSGSVAPKQIISPRAPVSKDKQNAAIEKGIKDFLYEQEEPVGMVGLDFTVDLSRLVFGKDSSPTKNEARARGFSMSNAVYQHVHISF